MNLSYAHAAQAHVERVGCLFQVKEKIKEHKK